MGQDRVEYICIYLMVVDNKIEEESLSTHSRFQIFKEEAEMILE